MYDYAMTKYLLHLKDIFFKEIFDINNIFLI